MIHPCLLWAFVALKTWHILDPSVLKILAISSYRYESTIVRVLPILGFRAIVHMDSLIFFLLNMNEYSQLTFQRFLAQFHLRGLLICADGSRNLCTFKVLWSSSTTSFSFNEAHLEPWQVFWHYTFFLITRGQAAALFGKYYVLHATFRQNGENLCLFVAVLPPLYTLWFVNWQFICRNTFSWKSLAFCRSERSEMRMVF